jgi:hypothetical protein
LNSNSKRMDVVKAEETRIILLTVLDYYLEYHVGSMVFDNWDPAADHYLAEKERVEEHYQALRLDLLQQQLGSLIYRLIRRRDLQFVSYIKQQTGYDIDLADYGPEYDDAIALTPIRKYAGSLSEAPSNGSITDQASPLGIHRRVMTSTYDDGKHAHTEVSITLAGGSGSIYNVQGSNLPISAYWKDNNTITIETHQSYTPMIQHRTISSFDDLVKIEYVFLAE